MHLPEYDVMRLLRPFLESIKPGGQILDLGAGTGLQANEAASRGLHVVAVDLLDRPSDVTTKEIEWIKGSLEDYVASLAEDKKFDGILLQSIIHFFPKEYILYILLPAVLAHTTPGGSIAIETVSAQPEPELKKFQSFYSPEELADALGGKIMLSEKEDTQRPEDSRIFHHTRVIVRR